MTLVAEMLTALCQEPWCFGPETIAGLTDHQILHHYLLPAAERAKRMAEESRQGLPTAPPAAGGTPARRASSSGPDGEPGSPVHRRQVVEQAFMGTMGMSREAAERLYDRQLQQWRDEQGG